MPRIVLHSIDIGFAKGRCRGERDLHMTERFGFEHGFGRARYRKLYRFDPYAQFVTELALFPIGIDCFECIPIVFSGADYRIGIMRFVGGKRCDFHADIFGTVSAYNDNLFGLCTDAGGVK